MRARASLKKQAFRVFVSSTFKDMDSERRALQEFVFPRLQELCRRRGLRFQAVDLRWGVSKDAASDHQVIPICFEEIDRSQPVSLGPNFIALLGDRYGSYIPPPVIPEGEYSALSRHLCAEDRNCLDSCYARDDNAVGEEGEAEYYLRSYGSCSS